MPTNAMDPTERLRSVFAQALHIEQGAISDTLAYNGTPEWDSVGHMALVAELEKAFDVMLDTDDIIDMSSFGKSKQILAKYGVAF